MQIKVTKTERPSAARNASNRLQFVDVTIDACFAGTLAFSIHYDAADVIEAIEGNSTVEIRQLAGELRGAIDRYLRQDPIV